MAAEALGQRSEQEVMPYKVAENRDPC